MRLSRKASWVPSSSGVLVGGEAAIEQGWGGLSHGCVQRERGGGPVSPRHHCVPVCFSQDEILVQEMLEPNKSSMLELQRPPETTVPKSTQEEASTLSQSCGTHARVHARPGPQDRAGQGQAGAGRLHARALGSSVAAIPGTPPVSGPHLLLMHTRETWAGFRAVG